MKKLNETKSKKLSLNVNRLRELSEEQTNSVVGGLVRTNPCFAGTACSNTQTLPPA